MTKFRLSVIIAVIILTVASFAADISAFANDCTELRKSVLRLHVVANSDSEADQAVKLEVRDLLLKETENRIKDADGKADIERYFSENSENIELLVEDFLKKRGFDYGAEVSLSHSYFETREYNGNTLPSGDYDALKVTLGSGEGKNWWCVMFPPLCISAADGDELPQKEYALMQSGSKPSYKLKLKIVEIFRGIKRWFS